MAKASYGGSEECRARRTTRSANLQLGLRRAKAAQHVKGTRLKKRTGQTQRRRKAADPGRSLGPRTRSAGPLHAGPGCHAGHRASMHGCWWHRMVQQLLARSPALRQALHGMHPALNSLGTAWQCARCGRRLDLAYVVHHQCRAPLVCLSEQHDVMLLTTRDGGTGRRRCRLCGVYVGARSHACQALRQVCFDFSALREEKQWGWAECPLGWVRHLPGHWVTVFSTAGSAAGRGGVVYLRHHLWVGPSPVGGLGAFTLTGLDPRRAPPAGEGAKGKGQGVAPLPTQQLVGVYTGAACAPSLGQGGGRRGAAPQQPRDARLGTVKLDGRALDGNKAGGVLVRANSAHGDRANADAVPLCTSRGQDQLYICAVARAAPGTEVLWDYRAKTDDAADPLLEVACKCMGKATEEQHLPATGSVVKSRDCCGRIIQLSRGPS